MPKQIKILLILFVVAVVVVLYLIIISKPIDDLNSENSKVQQEEKQEAYRAVDLEQLKNDYKLKFKEVFSNYLSLVQSVDIRMEELDQIKGQLLDLRVPTEFKDLHIDFLFVITKMENFLETGDIEEKNNSQELINKIKVNYNWLD